MLIVATALAAPTVQDVEVPIGGTPRTAKVVLPEGVERPPIVVTFHGIGGAGGMGGRWADVASKEGVLVVAPQIPEVSGWFDGRPEDHRSFDRALFTGWRDWAVAQGGDPERVYLAGYSMGAHYAVSLYCSGVEVAGVAAVGMSMTKTQEADCTPRPAPFVYVANQQDRLATAGPRTVSGLRFELVSQEKTLERLYAVNGCEGAPAEGVDTRASCGATPVTAHRMNTKSHALNANGFDPAAYAWKKLTAR